MEQNDNLAIFIKAIHHANVLKTGLEQEINDYKKNISTLKNKIDNIQNELDQINEFIKQNSSRINLDSIPDLDSLEKYSGPLPNFHYRR